MKIYMIGYETTGPAGHGEPGMEQLCVGTYEGKTPFKKGKPFPFFENELDAYDFLTNNTDNYSSYIVVPLELRLNAE